MSKQIKMTQMTWLDLYNYLHAQANGLDNIGNFNWNVPVLIHDAESGDEYNCDTWVLSDSNKNEKLVLLINPDSIFR